LEGLVICFSEYPNVASKLSFHWISEW